MMENLKVKVSNNVCEIVELFIQYGCKYFNHTCTTKDYAILRNGKVFFCKRKQALILEDCREISIEQLYDMVVLKRNDVNDATHYVQVNNHKYYKGNDRFYFWDEGKWIDSFIENDIKPIEKKITETGYLMQGRNGEHLMESVGQLKDNVNQPSHYTSGGIECLEAMQAMLSRDEFIGFLRGNVFKYNWRYQLKNGVEDLKKAQFYQNKLIELESDDTI